MLKKLKSLVKEMNELIDEMIEKEDANASNPSNQAASEGKSSKPEKQQSKEEVKPIQTSNDSETEWNYGYWKEAKTYDDIKAAMVEAQTNKRPILIALSKLEGCNNCKNYWRNVVCDGVLGHDKNCNLASKKHPIVNYAKEKKIVMLYISPSNFPNIQNKIMGKEYSKYLHTPVFYPIYFVVSVKDGIDMNKVKADDKILNAGDDAGDTVDFIMGYIGLGGKPVLDSNGIQTMLKVKTDSTGWNVFKSNLETIFSDKSKTHGIIL